ncbi:class A beta-lactamase [Vineibacter terrae]|uniref:beta-lactamase n=1 Tax=Vineibacter terrae TaxID=2586908 RepID=A0A5C8PFG6_9HYPH|nr:class A beta-lactamase [Vineibacter terrae]TXL71904.1 class A beta-lactamase [Vineibacter terrae]
MINRRSFTAAACGILIGGTVAARTGLARQSGLPATLADTFKKIEADSGGRLGVAVLDTQTGTSAGHRADELFAMCSSFKMLAAAAVLARVDAGKEKLDRRVPVQASDIIPYSPAVKERVGGTMSLAELCAATVTLSDNAAANLILATFGGPAAVTAFVRSIGDGVTRLDRTEPTLNEARADDPRDTTSPAAMAATIQKLVLGTALSAASREQLTAWLVGNKTGDARLRAGVPRDWRVGDKTGTCNSNTANDVGLAWPPGRQPVIMSVYLTGATVNADRQNAAIASVARAVATALA